MKQKIWDILSVLSVANLLAVILLLVGLLATGGLNGNKLGLIRRVISGDGLPVVQVTATAPDRDEAPAVSGAGARIQKEQIETSIRQLQIEQQLRELKDFQVQLDQARATLAGRISQFEQERVAWDRSRQAEREALASEGFKKALELIESLPAEQARDLLMAMSDAEAVRFLKTLEPRKSAKIARTFESPAEKARLSMLLDRIKAGVPQAEAPAATPSPDEGKARS